MESKFSNATNAAILKTRYRFLDFDNLETLHLALSNSTLLLIDEATYKIIDALDISIYWKDLEGRYLGCNQYMLDMNGFKSRDEIIGKTDEECIWKDQASRLREVDQTVIIQKKTMHTEESVVIVTGEIIDLATVKKPIFNKQEEVVAIMGASTDITNYKKYLIAKIQAEQEAKQAILISETEKQYRAAVTTHSGGMVHDLKNALHVNGLTAESLQWKLQMFEHTQPTVEMLKAMNKQLQTILENNAKMDKIIEDSNKMIAQIASDKPEEVLTQKISMEKLIRQSTNNYSMDIENQLLSREVLRDFEVSVDIISFYRIISNLVDNAKRQIELKKKGEIFITAKETEVNGQKVKKCIVKDTAGGLTQEMIDKIFDLYKTKEVQGTGIGLQSCQLLMERMGGTITANLVDGDCIAFELSFVETEG